MANSNGIFPHEVSNNGPHIQASSQLFILNCMLPDISLVIDNKSDRPVLSVDNHFSTVGRLDCIGVMAPVCPKAVAMIQIKPPTLLQRLFVTKSFLLCVLICCHSNSHVCIFLKFEFDAVFRVSFELLAQICRLFGTLKNSFHVFVWKNDAVTFAICVESVFPVVA